MIWRRRSDLPMAHDATSRFLPWLVALMVFLAALALAMLFVIGNLVGRWDRDVAGTLTVQVAPVLGEGGDLGTQERVEATLRLLRDTQGVLAARALTQPELVGLIEPWLGSSDLVRDLPLPRLLDVTVDPRQHIDLGALGQKLSQAVPGASLDDHRVWLSRLVNLSRTIELLAAASVMLIGLVTALTVIYATRTGMAVHGEVIEVLHLTGAQDDYIARQFAERVFGLGLSGGLLGVAAAVPALVAIAWMARNVEGGFLPDLSLPAGGWLAIAVLPAAVALMMMLTARITVQRTLSRLP
jgi:cell division transport system permease protein